MSTQKHYFLPLAPLRIEETIKLCQQIKPQHATIKLEQWYFAPPERVFAEFADPVARARWSAPSNDVLIYQQYRSPRFPSIDVALVKRNPEKIKRRPASDMPAPNTASVVS
jgi:hypothetical protein